MKNNRKAYFEDVRKNKTNFYDHSSIRGKNCLEFVSNMKKKNFFAVMEFDGKSCEIVMNIAEKESLDFYVIAFTNNQMMERNISIATVADSDTISLISKDESNASTQSFKPVLMNNPEMIEESDDEAVDQKSCLESVIESLGFNPADLENKNKIGTEFSKKILSKTETTKKIFFLTKPIPELGHVSLEDFPEASTVNLKTFVSAYSKRLFDSSERFGRDLDNDPFQFLKENEESIKEIDFYDLENTTDGLRTTVDEDNLSNFSESEKIDNFLSGLLISFEEDCAEHGTILNFLYVTNEIRTHFEDLKNISSKIQILMRLEEIINDNAEFIENSESKEEILERVKDIENDVYKELEKDNKSFESFEENPIANQNSDLMLTGRQLKNKSLRMIQLSEWAKGVDVVKTLEEKSVQEWDMGKGLIISPSFEKSTKKEEEEKPEINMIEAPIKTKTNLNIECSKNCLKNNLRHLGKSSCLKKIEFFFLSGRNN